MVKAGVRLTPNVRVDGTRKRAKRRLQASVFERVVSQRVVANWCARQSLAQYLMIPHERVPLAVINAEGLDADIAALCA
jgi:hypothetical protein